MKLPLECFGFFHLSLMLQSVHYMKVATSNTLKLLRGLWKERLPLPFTASKTPHNGHTLKLHAGVLYNNTNQIKSNHFYCHITTAQVPWWVKFLWACSRQCRKTTDNLPMDRQCKKKTTNNLHMDRQCKKNNKQFTYRQTVQKKQQTIYI